MSSKAQFDFVNIFFGLIQPIQLFFLLIKHKPDLIYTNWAQTLGGFLRYASFIIIISLFRIPIVVRVMGDGFHHFYTSAPFPLKGVIRFCLNQISGFIVRAERLKQQFGDEVPAEKLNVVYTGIDTDEFQVQRNRPEDDQIKILFVGYLTQAKGALDLLRAVPLIAGEHPNVSVELMGERLDIERNITYVDNPTSNNQILDQLLANPKIAANSKLLGILTGEDKIDKFVNADIFVMASYSESTPVVALEAMASGLPVVGTPVGLLPIVFDESNILFFEPGNIEELAKQVSTLIQNAEKRKEMGQHNRAVVTSSFNLEAYAERLNNLFAKLIKQDKTI